MKPQTPDQFRDATKMVPDHTEQHLEMVSDTPRTVSAMSLKQNYDLSEKDCLVYENYVHAEVCAEIERELAASLENQYRAQAEVERLRELLGKVLFELEKVPFQTPKLTAFTAHRIADRYRDQLNQLNK